MATVTLRPTSGSGSSWSNIANAYDTNTSTAATVNATSSNYSSRIATFNFDISVIPANATINSATLNVRYKQSSSTSTRRYTPYIDINGSSSNRVINSQLTNTSTTTKTANIVSYISTLSTITITPYRAGSSGSNTLSVYDIYIDVDYELSKATYTVTFMDWNGTVLKTQTVEEGSSATAPSNPTRDGYTFIGWSESYTNVTSNLTIMAQYEEADIENLKIGNITVNGCYIGTEKVIEIYLGNFLIYSKK